MEKPKKLTAAEEQIMQALWSLGKGGYMKDVLDQLGEGVAHYNTVGTLLKILTEKNFVDSSKQGRNHFYSPLVSREEYSRLGIRGLAANYFGGSYTNIVSFLVDKKEISLEELEFLLEKLKSK
jgi:BlaI family transcriptional regulator, penicillinase repressor